MNKDITVIYKENKIFIEYNKKYNKNHIEIPITELYSLELETGKQPVPITNVKNFINDQQHLRALDCMKDAMIEPNINTMVYEVCYPNLNKKTFTTLATLEQKFMTHFKNEINQYTWTKISKETSLQPKIKLNTIFIESGLSSDYYIDNNIFCWNFANEIIDPAGRQQIKKNDIFFPNNKESIFFDKSLLELFGFINCSVYSQRKGVKNYNFDINIDGVSIDKTITTIKNENVSINWFNGNKEKNKFLKNPPKNSKLSQKTKNAVFMCKEFGDFLQILFVFIWSKIYKNTYSITTCDNVVMLQSMIMGVNCILTSRKDEKTKNDKIKVRCIQFFEPNTDTPEKAIVRFNDEKEAILTHNNIFKEVITGLIKKKQIIYASSDQSIEYNFNKKFYEDIYNDLTVINNNLNLFKLKANSTKNEIENEIQYIKKNYLFIHFLKKDKTKIKILNSYKKYTSGDDWKKKYGPILLNYNKKNFYEIGLEYNSIFTSVVGGSFYRTPENNKTELNKEINITEKDANQFRSIEFETEALFYDKDTEKEYNLYDVLNKQIEENLIKLNLNNYLIDFKNLLYHHFYLNNEVLYDNELTIFIHKLKTNEINIIKNKSLNISPKNKRKHLSFSNSNKENNYFNYNPITNKRKLSSSKKSSNNNSQINNKLSSSIKKYSSNNKTKKRRLVS